MKKVENSIVTGMPVDVIYNLKITLGLLKLNYTDIKIGITGRDPQARFNEHQRDGGWERMIVKYQTTSENFANKVEDYFINKYPKLKNEWVGYSNLSCKFPTYYVYFIMKGKKNKV